MNRRKTFSSNITKIHTHFLSFLQNCEGSRSLFEWNSQDEGVNNEKINPAL